MSGKKEKQIRIARKGVRFLDDLLGFLVLAILLLLISFGCYALWDARQVHYAGTSVQYEVYKPTEENNLSLEELQSINPEVIGWITIYGTSIDYPLLQGKDNRKYVSTAVDGSYSLAGAIFLDVGCKPNFSGYNNLIHGHNMTENAMFGQINEFRNPDFFEEHVYGNLVVNGKSYGIVLFEYAQADAYDRDIYRLYFQDEADQKNWLKKLRSTAIQYRDSGQEKAKHLVMLNTCSSSFTNARDFVVGYLTKETYEDPFLTVNNKPVFQIDRLMSWKEWNRIPLWIWMLLLLLFLFLLSALVNRKIEKARIRRALREEEKKEKEEEKKT